MYRNTWDLTQNVLRSSKANSKVFHCMHHPLHPFHILNFFMTCLMTPAQLSVMCCLILLISHSSSVFLQVFFGLAGGLWPGSSMLDSNSCPSYIFFYIFTDLIYVCMFILSLCRSTQIFSLYIFFIFILAESVYMFVYLLDSFILYQ